jgi:hypothetical protein
MSNMTLLKTVSKREGNEYTDFYLAWRNNDGVRYLRIRTVFGGLDFHRLNKLATEFEGLEAIEKYV